MSIFRKISRLPVWKLRRTNTLNYFKFQNFSQKIPDLEELDIDENIKNDKRRVLDDELRELSKIMEYTEGVRLFIDNKLSFAEENFKLSLDKLRNDEDFKPKLLAHVLQKLCMVLKLQNKDNELTEYLEEAYFISLSEENPNYEQVVKCLSNLITHYCIKDVEKGLVLCDTILEQLSNEAIPLIHAKEVYYLLGSMYLVAGDYTKAIKYLEECINLKPKPIIREGMALHNLAYSYWAGYNSFVGKEAQEIEKNLKDVEKLDKNDEDFKNFEKKIMEAGKENKNVIPYFKRAIKSFEYLFEDDPIKFPRKEKDKLTPRQFAALTLILNEGSEKVDSSQWKQEDLAMRNPLSSLSALNIGEVLYQAGVLEQALFWIKLSLEISSKTNFIARNLRGMVILALIHQEQEKHEFAEKMLIDCLEYMENLPIYNKIVCLETYSQFLVTKKRIYEAEEYFNQAKLLREKIPYWHERKEALQLPDYNF